MAVVLEQQPCMSPAAPPVKSTAVKFDNSCRTCAPGCPCCPVGTKQECVYVPPEVPKSFKPVKKYLPPEKGVYDTTYNKTYVPKESTAQKMIFHEDNITVGVGKMDTNTVNRLSYVAPTNFRRPAEFRLCDHNLQENGPVQLITTHKHDYIPLPLETKSKTDKYEDGLTLSKAPFDGTTVTQLSYIPLNVNEAKVFPYRYKDNMKLSAEKIDLNTINQLSYKFWGLQPPEEKPWAKAKAYEKSGPPLESSTIYHESYPPYALGPKLQSYKPLPKYLPPEKFDDGTVYRMSYKPAQTDKPQKFEPKHAIGLSPEKIYSETTNNSSFRWYSSSEISRESLHRLSDHKLIGDGPMQLLTTQKQDYVPMPFERAQPLRMGDNLTTSNQPFTGQTCYRASYQPVESGNNLVKPIRCRTHIKLPDGPMDLKTVHQTSYTPIGQQPPVSKPWAEKLSYEPPKLLLEGHTTNSLSYQPPGRFVCTSKPDPSSTAKCCCPSCCCASKNNPPQ
ncbi:stabilizer of axonemal microtubules 2-like [Agrilus planipennis]|uniref:Stabilizer of axonemal microtubules 2-like n=1 Tax=Agrilus planipennis TaxID=224129 RepID=A0A1W4X5W9_AGRPL|nr:stabilizer of axonemal microtubules 2-like [Agrilus planipennis]